ncbi:MAG: J domain-containing protein [Ilumatobacteraceae bacterium]|jgi:molecular chaperone DnaJ|nr:J domain-containing protein [Actinomycetota bacterium]
MAEDHYSVLGVGRGAGQDEIRTAYRREARRLHPDSAGAGSSTQMAQLNEAYRVLSDPGRRALYDRAGAEPRTSASGEYGVHRPPTPPAHMPPATPARFPWRFVVVLALLGAIVVLVGALTSSPEAEGEVDGILRTGSCAEVDRDSFAREVPCTLEPGELVVEALIPTDQDCPLTTLSHLDRLGLGRACLSPRP